MLLPRHFSRTAAVTAALIISLFLVRRVYSNQPFPISFESAENSFYGSLVHETSAQSQVGESDPTDVVPDADLPESLPTITSGPGLDLMPAEANGLDQPHKPGNQPQSPVGTSVLSKAIVMGKLSRESTDWVTNELQDWEHSIYVVDLPMNETTSPTGLRTKKNKAKEAFPYLTYIVENYPDFPDVSVFIHAHRNGWPQAWHNDARDYDAVNMLQGLKLDTVLDRGYVNLRCQHVPGCPAEIRLYDPSADPERYFEQIYAFVYADFFNMTIKQVIEEVPIVASPCCAQFAVSREQLLKRPKSEYERYRNYIEASSYADEDLGTVMEYMWHVMFGKPAVMCEEELQCYAAVYGGRAGYAFLN